MLGVAIAILAALNGKVWHRASWLWCLANVPWPFLERPHSVWQSQKTPGPQYGDDQPSYGFNKLQYIPDWHTRVGRDYYSAQRDANRPHSRKLPQIGPCTREI